MTKSDTKRKKLKRGKSSIKYNSNRNRSKNSSKYKRKHKVKYKKFMLLIVIFVFMYGIFKTFSLMEERLYVNNNQSKEDFIKQIEEVAIVGYRETGLLPSITLSQAILESNWGKSKLATEGNNLYGIKADKSWYGQKIKFETKEYYDKKEVAYFRKYSSWQESVRDYINFLNTNNRYKKHGLYKSKSYKGQAQALENAGYATTTNSNGEKIYADKLIKIIESRKLYEIDKKVLIE